MPFEFIAKKGFTTPLNASVSGSLTVLGATILQGVSGSFTGSHVGNTVGTASWANSASFSLTSSNTIFVGTNNYIPKWSSNQLTSTSSIYDTGTKIGIGTITPTSSLDILVYNPTGSSPLNVVNILS